MKKKIILSILLLQGFSIGFSMDIEETNQNSTTKNSPQDKSKNLPEEAIKKISKKMEKISLKSKETEEHIPLALEKSSKEIKVLNTAKYSTNNKHNPWSMGKCEKRRIVAGDPNDIRNQRYLIEDTNFNEDPSLQKNPMRIFPQWTLTDMIKIQNSHEQARFLLETKKNSEENAIYHEHYPKENKNEQ